MKKIRIVCFIVALSIISSGFVYGYNNEFSGQAIANFKLNNINATNVLMDQKYNKPISREDISELIVALSDVIQTSNSDIMIQENPFKDTQSESAIRAYYLGYMSGKSDTIFAPDDYVTREEFATILMHFLNVNGITLDKKSDMSNFVDFDLTSTWASDAVAYCVENGFIAGKNHGLDPLLREFAPKDFLTTEEALTILDKVSTKYNWIETSDDIYINQFYIPRDIECSVTSGAISGNEEDDDDIDAVILYIIWDQVNNREKMETDLKTLLENGFEQSAELDNIINVLLYEPVNGYKHDKVELNEGSISYKINYGSISLILAKE